MQLAIFSQINLYARFWLIYQPDSAENWYTCTFYDDACLKESIFKKLLLVVANLYNLQFFSKYICVHGMTDLINPILLKIDIHVRFTMMHV